MEIFPLYTIGVDANFAAPAPASALISTGLVNAGFLAVFRVYRIMEQTEAIGWVRNVLLLTGILSLAVGALFLRRTNNYKRFLSYSTVENMGIAAIGLGIGGIGVWAAVFHVVCHTLVKSSLFLQMAVVRRIYNGYRINRIGDYIRINPTGAAAGLSALAVLRLGGDALPRNDRRRAVVGGRHGAPAALHRHLLGLLPHRQTLLPAQSGLSAPRSGAQRPVVGGLFAAGGGDGRRHLAARAAATTHRSNRLAIMHYYVTDNRAACMPLNEIPTAGYAEFYEDLAERLADERYHIGHYFALPDGDVLRAYCLLLDDTEHRVLVASYAIGYYDTPLLPSLTARHPQVHPFERG